MKIIDEVRAMLRRVGCPDSEEAIAGVTYIIDSIIENAPRQPIDGSKMIPKSHTFKAEGKAETDVARVACARCHNSFFVEVLPENPPSYCCYCGTQFTHEIG